MDPYFFQTQTKIYRLANIMLHREQLFFEQYGLTQKQFNILRILRGAYPQSLSLSEIGARMIDRSSDVTRLCSRLTQKQLILITVNKNDKRYKDATISKQGSELLAKIDKVVRNGIGTGIEHLTLEECQVLTKLMDKIAGDIELPNNIIVK